MRKIFISGILTCLITFSAQATSLEVTLNDDSVQAQAGLTLNEDSYGTSILTVRGLYDDEESTKLGSAGFDFMGRLGNVPGLEVGVGAQVYSAKTDRSLDLLTLGIGVRATFTPPLLQGFGIKGKAFYAPKILSGLDAERLIETGADVFYAITPKVRVLLGYQLIRASFEKVSTRNIDEGARIGFEARF